MSGWIGVDLDGTLAEYDGWKGIEHIGAPIPAMVERVKGWLAEGREVRIFTARIAEPGSQAAVRYAVNGWCREHLGQQLPITCTKDFGMVELWDDRAVGVAPNTGHSVAAIQVALWADRIKAELHSDGPETKELDGPLGQAIADSAGTYSLEFITPEQLAEGIAAWLVAE